MSRSTRVAIAVAAFSAVVLTAASVATAKTCGVVKSSSGCATGGVEIVEKHDGKMVKTLGTCDKAIAALHEKHEGEFVAIHEKHESKRIEIAEKIEALEREIDEIIKADEPDLKKLESRLKKISDVRFELTKLRFRMHKEARGVVEEADRAALDRHFAMGVGCCGGVGMQATYHPGCPAGKFDMKSCCPGGMASHCVGSVDMKSCCPGHEGHTSMTSPRVMFVGDGDGHAEIQVLDDVRGLLGCAPGILGEKHIEVLLDDEDDGMRRIEVLLDDDHDTADHIEILLDEEDLAGDAQRIIKRIHAAPGRATEDLEGDARRIIKRVRALPGGEADDLIRMPRGGSVGPF